MSHQEESLLPAPLRGAGVEERVENDPRVCRTVRPCRIVWRTTAEGAVIENPEALLEERPGQITLSPRNPCVLRHEGAAPGILLDFGVEMHGGVQILVGRLGGDRKSTRLRVRFGESAMEAMSELPGAHNATNDHAVRDQVAEVSFLSMPEFGPTGFRFVRIDLPEEGASVQITGVRALFTYRDLDYLGSFHCSDERLNRIWNTAAYTVHLNMQGTLWDGIKRDRLVWVGDMHPEVSTICAVFGYDETVPASLDLIRDETPLPGWMNGISSYSLWWVLIHHRWHLQNGDTAYLREQRDYLVGLLAQLLECVAPDDREQMPPMRFLDWPSVGNDAAVHAGLQSLLTLALDAGAGLCDTLGEPGMADRCRAGAAHLRRTVPPHGDSKQAAALMALAGLGDPAALNRDVLAVDGARRLSTFYGYYVLQARALAGDIQGSLDAIREYWGAMLDLGATTFWEDFNLDWTENAAGIDDLVPPGKRDIHGDFGAHCYQGFRHSLCHGWASGPAAWLSEHVLGIRVLEPGCRAVSVTPHLGDLEWAEGAYPTPLGILVVRHTRDSSGNISSEIHAPDGIRVERG